MRTLLIWAAAAIAVACGANAPATAEPEPAPVNPRETLRQRVRTVRETVTVRDPELEKRMSRLELQVLEKEAQVAELQTRLEDARDEVVRTMAKLETLNSRAEAASGMAEADVALQALRNAAGGAQSPELSQANRLIRRSNAEFEKRNFGGALYLANQSRALAIAGRARLTGNRGTLRQGESQFAVPVRLKVMSKGNVREGPGTTFAVLYSLEPGAVVTAFSHTDEWVRVTDDGGRSGWIFRTLVGRP